MGCCRDEMVKPSLAEERAAKLWCHKAYRADAAYRAQQVKWRHGAHPLIGDRRKCLMRHTVDAS